MSGHIVGRVLWADLPAHLKLTAVIIADAANDEGYAYPGLKRIAAQLGRSVRQTRYNIAELREREILTITPRGQEGGGRSSNGYQINLAALPMPPEAKRQPASPLGGAKRQSVSPLGGQSGNPLPVQSGNPAQAKRQSSAGKAAIQIATEPSEEPSEEPSVSSSSETQPRTSTANRNRAGETKPEPDPRDLDTAQWMLALVRKVSPSFGARTDLKRWADQIRLMRTRDGRSDAEIRGLFEWAHADQFWKANIHSPDTLRRQWDKLELKRSANGTPKSLPAEDWRQDEMWRGAL